MEQFHGRVLKIKVLLEGVEIDAISIAVRSGFNDGARASVQIPFHEKAFQLLPRTLIHIFFYENAAVLDPTSNRGATPDGNRLSNWKLLFAGEVLGYQHADVGSVKQITLTCQDFSSYWQHAKLYWGTNNIAVYNQKVAITAGAIQMYSGKRRTDTTDELFGLLNAEPATIPRLTGVLGGLVALLEAATGVYHPAAKKRFRGVNDFMSQAELRLKLTHMIGATSEDTSSLKFIDNYQFKQYLRRLARSMGQTSSFIDLVNLFLNRIYYSWVSVPAPPFFLERDKVAKTQIVKVRNVQGKTDAEIQPERDKTAAFAKQVAARIREIDGRKTGGNDIGIYVSEGKRDTQAHSVFGTTKAAADFTNMVNSWAGYDNPTWLQKKYAELDRQGPNQSDRYRALITSNARVKGKAALKVLNTMKIVSDGVYPNHTAPNLRELDTLLKGMLADYGRWLGGGNVSYTLPADIGLGDRLHAHLFLPDLYMAPPPTCNVLFPDHYTQLRFSRNWMSEITRLILHTRTQSGQDVKDLYFSPNTDIVGDTNKNDIDQAIKKGISFLMQHEKYTGVIAAMDVVGDASIFKKIHDDAKAAANEPKKIGTKQKDPAAPINANVSGEALFSPMEHLRRAANYLFFAKRFEGRSMSVTCRFSPQIVVGLPMLIITKTQGGKIFEKKPDGTPDTTVTPNGTHFLGLVAAVEHDVDAQGNAMTRVELTKCRDHREGLDIFGGGYDNVVEIKTVKTPITVRKTRGLEFPNNTISFTYDGNNSGNFTVIRVNEPVKKGMTTKEAEAQDYSPHPSETNLSMTAGELLRKAKLLPKKGAQYTIRVEHSHAGEGDFNGKPAGLANEPDNPGKVVGPGGIPVKDKETGMDVQLQVTVTESSPGVRTNTAKIQYSFENTATPPWLAPIYYPSAIGNSFYMKMLGCRSVLDVLPLTSIQAANPTATEPEDTLLLNVNKGDSRANVRIPAELLKPAITVERAADNLAETWERLRSLGADMPLFIQTYGNRSYASFPQIMGTGNDYLNVRGSQFFITDDDPKRNQGFHENAYGLLENLQDVDGNPMSYEPLPTGVNTPATGIEKPATTDTAQVDSTCDPRKERWDRVEDYTLAIGAETTSPGNKLYELD